jgi:hypothetical protein
MMGWEWSSHGEARNSLSILIGMLHTETTTSEDNMKNDIGKIKVLRT